MPKPRARGYKYFRNANGKRVRVYGGVNYMKPYKGKAPRRTYKKKNYVRRKPYVKRGRVDQFGDTIMGYGGYRSSRGNKILAGNPPTVQNSSGGFIVRHREYIGDVPSSAAFQNFSFPLNPGLAVTFPWLASLAENFEEWIPRGIIFEYKTMSSDAVVSANANAGLGSVIMATEYNPYAGTFGNKQQMENYEGAVSCKPSVSCMHAVECSKFKNPMGSYYTRTGPVPSGQDLRLYDLGTFQLAVQGTQSTGTVMGELWVSFEVEFRKPRLPAGTAGTDNGNTNMDHFQLWSSLDVGVTGIDPAHPLGTVTTPFYPTNRSTLGGVVCGGVCPAASFTVSNTTPTKANFAGGINQLDTAKGASGTVGNPTGALGPSTVNTYYFPPGVTNGNFMIQLSSQYNTTGTGFDMSAGITYINAKNLLLFNGDATAGDGAGNVTGSNARDGIYTFFVTVTGPNASVAMTATSTMTNVEWADLYVIQLPPVIN